MARPAATPASAPATIASVATTKNRFVLQISRSGLQSGFRLQGSTSALAQSAIPALSMPRCLNTRTETVATTVADSPSAKNSVPIQRLASRPLSSARDSNTVLLGATNGERPMDEPFDGDGRS